MIVVEEELFATSPVHIGDTMLNLIEKFTFRRSEVCGCHAVTFLQSDTYT